MQSCVHFHLDAQYSFSDSNLTRCLRALIYPPNKLQTCLRTSKTEAVKETPKEDLVDPLGSILLFCKTSRRIRSLPPTYNGTTPGFTRRSPQGAFAKGQKLRFESCACLHPSLDFFNADGQLYAARLIVERQDPNKRPSRLQNGDDLCFSKIFQLTLK